MQSCARCPAAAASGAEDQVNRERVARLSLSAMSGWCGAGRRCPGSLTLCPHVHLAG